MAWRIGVDSGGTFTDVCLFDDATGAVAVWKVPSTPADPSQGIADGVTQGIGRVGASPAAIGYFGHGTTVATNALIQHRGARTGLITTDGFRDLLEIGRQKRPDLYDIQVDKPPTLVSRDLRLEVPERVRHDGSVEIPLDAEAVRTAVRTLRAAASRRSRSASSTASSRRRMRRWPRASWPRNFPTPSPPSPTTLRRSSASSSACRPPW